MSPPTPPAIRLLLASLIPLITFDTPFSPLRIFSSTKSYIYIFYGILYALALLWTSLINQNVLEPYLDEVFHIPQAQAYCDARYDVWDPKLTTPPGLYILSTIFVKAYWAANCSPSILRLFNATTSIFLLAYASDCRELITCSWSPNPSAAITKWRKDKKPLRVETMHTAFNIALFPVLFFFSGLFYTDVLSTAVVLRVYRLFLERQSSERSIGSGLWIYVAGIVALAMRQTNIFWVAVFLGGMEAVQAVQVSSKPAAGKVEIPSGSLKGMVLAKFGQWSRGQIHNPELVDAGLQDYVLCVTSIVIAAIFRPFTLLGRIWPYIFLLASFAGFVYWNDGVVLGDKTNHIPTLHLPQLLYLSPLFTFFSFPLLLSPILTFLSTLTTILRTPLFPRLIWKYFFISLFTGTSLSVTLMIIKFNTIIHPFTLADNRHYMFYVFRYTILRHPLVRFLLAPVYIGCAWAIYLALCTPLASTPQLKLNPKVKNTNTTQNNRSTSTSKSKPQTPNRTLPIPLPPSTTAAAAAAAAAAAPRPGLKAGIGGPRVSFALIWILATSLSLITAPLVEPRYFIIPWVVWRLNVPSLSSSHSNTPAKGRLGARRYNNLYGVVMYWMDQLQWYISGAGKEYDLRLWMETAWHLVISGVTCYIFLYRGFEWEQEPGRVQRFMW